VTVTPFIDQEGVPPSDPADVSTFLPVVGQNRKTSRNLCRNVREKVLKRILFPGQKLAHRCIIYYSGIHNMCMVSPHYCPPVLGTFWHHCPVWCDIQKLLQAPVEVY
jgi:hypothetical protein